MAPREDDGIRLLAETPATVPTGPDAVASLAGTRCPVCGVALTDPLWTCPRCLTLHHSDCAGYFGGCAVFGCRDNRAPERMETRHWPAAYGHLKRFLLFKALQRSLLIPLVIGGVLLGCGIPAEIPAFIVIGMSLLWLAAVGYLVLEAPARLWWFWLKWSLGGERSLEITLPRERLRAALVHGKKPWWSGKDAPNLAFRLTLAGLVLWPLVGAGPLGGALAGILLAWKCGEQYEEDRARFGVLLSRFEASYAPLPDKAPRWKRA